MFLAYFIYESGVYMYDIYLVKEGDTLSSIANEYGTTVEILRQINGILSDSGISVGTLIVVPVLRQQPFQYYTVKKGDNLEMIARDNDIDYSLLLELNGLDDGDYIYPNQTILLPKKGFGIYMTQNDDTLNYVLNRIGINIDDLLRENENIYLRPEQILIFREK